MVVGADDADSKNNTVLVFTLTSNLDKDHENDVLALTIDISSGEIKSKEPLDRERYPRGLKGNQEYHIKQLYFNED